MRWERGRKGREGRRAGREDERRPRARCPGASTARTSRSAEGPERPTRGRVVGESPAGLVAGGREYRFYFASGVAPASAPWQPPGPAAEPMYGGISWGVWADQAGTRL